MFWGIYRGLQFFDTPMMNPFLPPVPCLADRCAYEAPETLFFFEIPHITTRRLAYSSGQNKPRKVIAGIVVGK